MKLRKVSADSLFTCGFSRPACGPAPPPLGAEGRAGPAGEFNREEKERLGSPLESVVDAFILKEAGRDSKIKCVWDCSCFSFYTKTF